MARLLITGATFAQHKKEAEYLAALKGTGSWRSTRRRSWQGDGQAETS
jgi:hypothetical protein